MNLGAYDSPSMVGPSGAVPIRQREVGPSEVLSALSYALDLTEGQPPGHTLRTTLIGMRLADDLGVTSEQREALYYALLLKDAGCSSNAARMAVLFGSPDSEVKYRMKLVDWHRPGRLALQTLRSVGRGRSLRARAGHLLQIAQTKDMTRDLVAIRCDRGADIVRQIGFPEAAAATVRALDEHWNGKGYPDGRSGEQIPVLARIALLAQTVEIYWSARGLSAAMRMVRQRRGTWFDPHLVDLVLAWRSDRPWWDSLHGPELSEQVIAEEPSGPPNVVDDGGLDRIAGAFAEIIDAKSPYTYRHSTRVADYGRGVAQVMGFSAHAAHRVYRAGLLHDIGKLGISNRILDKNGSLTPEERQQIESHPIFSWEILSRVDAFRDFAEPAVLHHEKLDGSGYPWGRTAEQLEPAARILAVVDIYEALTADRPYRAGMTRDRAMGIIRDQAGSKLCSLAIEGLEAFLDGHDEMS